LVFTIVGLAEFFIIVYFLVSFLVVCIRNCYYAWDVYAERSTV